jgi:hypothetical protein
LVDCANCSAWAARLLLLLLLLSSMVLKTNHPLGVPSQQSYQALMVLLLLLLQL